jgi:hypothetical protein
VISAISVAVTPATGGRLLARLLWQITGSFVGSSLVAAFADARAIDFSQITSVAITTDGRTITQQG